MQIVRAEGATSPARPPADPTVEALIDQTSGGGGLAVTEVMVPPGTRMREHDHGGSEALLIPLDGRLAVTSGSQRQDISRGMVVLVGREERVQLSNQTSDPFTMIVVFTPVPQPPTAWTAPAVEVKTLEEVTQWMAVPPEVVGRLNDDEAAHVDLAGHPICLARSGGVFYALLDECSHGHVELSEGEVEDGQVECWLHGSRFDLATGIPVCLPATQPVPVYPVRTIDGGIAVAVPPSPPRRCSRHSRLRLAKPCTCVGTPMPGSCTGSKVPTSRDLRP